MPGFFVTAPGNPHDFLLPATDFQSACAWAKRESVPRGTYLQVRHSATGEIHAMYAPTGQRVS